MKSEGLRKEPGAGMRSQWTLNVEWEKKLIAEEKCLCIECSVVNHCKTARQIKNGVCSVYTFL